MHLPLRALAQEHDPITPLPAAIWSRAAVQVRAGPPPSPTFVPVSIPWADLHPVLGQCNRPEPAQTPGAQAGARILEGNFIAALDAIGKSAT